ncbi:MAG: membrane dipeptidase [Gammaproteobacteria bacterium]
MTQSRRTFLALASAAGALTQVSTEAATMRTAADRLENLLVINTLGALDDPNVPVPPNPGDAAPVLRPRVIADAHASGVTAINLTMGHVFGPQEPFEQTVRAVAQWDALIRDNAGDLLKVLSASDIRRAKAEKKIGVIFGFQNAAMLGDRAGRVDIFADLGVRVIQLTYNAPNALGGGSLAPGNPGLTPFGREVVERLNARRVIVDLSHSGQQICLDAVAASKEPIAITHTGCRALVDLPRNKTDEELKAVASKGGYVGIYFMPFLAIGRNVTGDDVVAHIEHALEVCGEDHIGIGTDGSFTQVDDLVAYQKNLEREVAARRAAGISAPGERPDIFPFAVDLRGPDQLRQLADRLAKRGHSEGRIEKILGLNFVRYAQRIWGA